MLCVAKLTLGQEGYYERSVADGLDDYYAGRGESPGVWVGRGARELELEGVVQEGELGQLIRGKDPHSGKQLRRHYRPRLITVERIDPFSGERTVEVQKLAPVAGFDLVFSVPKSVSLLHALGDEETRRAVNEAHLSAWQAALGYLEDEACVTRRGRNGVHREHAGGFVAAAYQHRTSRAQDPHLHTHVIVANMAQSPSDGKWRALDGEPILKSYRLAAGYVYEAHLRAELSRSLGVAWETPRKGWAELKGIPRRVVREFSTRRVQVEGQLQQRGGGGFYAAQRAAVATRERKEQLDLAGLREDWRARAAEHGLGRRELRALLGQAPKRELSSDELLATAKRLLGPDGLTKQRTAFSEPEVVMAWAEAHSQGAPAERVRTLAYRLTRTVGVEQVGERPGPGRPARYSTNELVALERAVLALVERGRDVEAPSISPEQLDEVERADRITLSAEQEQMVREVATSPSRVVCVVGLAGAGKTTATHAVAQVNQLARQLMDADGRLGTERLSVAEREFAAGDRIVCLRNNTVLGVKNGTTGTIERVDPIQRTLTLATDRGPTVELNRRYLESGNIRHAYALTGHAAQGLTVERAFVLGAGEARLREWGYVALSRARAQTRLYVTGTPRERESEFHVLDDPDALTRFGRALEESAIELLAVDQRPLPTGPRHQARPQIERTQLTPDARLHLRLLEQKRLALVKTRDIAAGRLETAQRELDRFSTLRRGRREQLRAEIALYRHAVGTVDGRLAETTKMLEQTKLQVRQAERTRGLPEREQPPLARQREPRVLGLER